MQWMKLGRQRYPVFRSTWFVFLFSKNHVFFSRLWRLPLSFCACVGMLVWALVVDVIYRLNVIASAGFSREPSNQLVSPSLYFFGDDFVNQQPLMQAIIDTSLMWPFILSAIWLIPQDILLNSSLVLMNLLCSPFALTHHAVMIFAYTVFGSSCELISPLYVTEKLDQQPAPRVVFYRDKRHSESKNALVDCQTLLLPFNPAHVMNTVFCSR